MQTRERKLKLAVTQLSEKRTAISEEIARERSRMEYEFAMRESVLMVKLAEAQLAAESVPPMSSPVAFDLPEFTPAPGSRTDPSSAIEAPSSIAPWAVEQLDAASRAEDWVASQEGKRAPQAIAFDPTQLVSSQQVLSLWSHQTTDSSTSMYYSSDEEDSFPLDNNAAIQYVDRKQSLKMVRAKVKQRSSDIMNGEQMLSEAEQQLIQVQFPLVFAGSCKALTKCVRIAGVADTN
jgi:hypothetical protein